VINTNTGRSDRPIHPSRRIAEASPPVRHTAVGRRAGAQRLSLLVACVVAAFALAASAPAADAKTSRPRPTVVLVHGAFADSSSWNGVIARLRRAGYPVMAPANPLRGIPYDAAYLASVVKTITGPVELVAHSYGGAVIGQAAAALPNVKALVFVDAFALDVGESPNSAGAGYTNVLLPSALLTRPFPLPDGQTGTEVYVEPSKFHAVMGADLPERTTALLAATQRPIASSAFSDTATAAAWKTIPSTFIIGRQDRAIDPDELRFMAHRAHGRTVEINASHLGLISRAATVARVIRQAAH
jgi:pimeloyl-ACP methyl ester carboxylesterase